jgi:GNAT superfamily N-acetyltransferase
MGTFRCWWRLFVETAVGYDGLWVTSGCEAVAVWVAPGRPELGPEQEQRAQRLIETLPSAEKLYLVETLARFEAARPERAHSYLSLLGVHEDHRGKGIGMALLAHTLKELDGSGSAAYLESTNPGNLKRYRSVGFVDLSAFTLPDNGPRVTTMWRHAQAGP